MTRRDIEQAPLASEESGKEIPFDRFLKVLLDFSLLSHEKFLKKFVDLFNEIDGNCDGMLDEEEMVQLINRLKIVDSDEQIDVILSKADPNNNKIITFSDCVQVFTETEVLIEGEEDGTGTTFTMNVIEKLNNIE
eukprot:CAMPEP_0116994102 /NCGR_PEP_ID=MMETSP0467-20121206/67901_1 /TAXON_ID=283647 /ORGANISM="Mesodinium pulex, Strain SPMC105" /LENGTH=134 /DNA_ID=CAMNT_0004692047 /DNA_START=1210 /DNA_END=1614 /DNA_ORIENTATION=-